MKIFRLSVQQYASDRNQTLIPEKTFGKITSHWRWCQAVVSENLCKTLNKLDLLFYGVPFLHVTDLCRDSTTGPPVVEQMEVACASSLKGTAYFLPFQMAS